MCLIEGNGASACDESCQGWPTGNRKSCLCIGVWNLSVGLIIVRCSTVAYFCHRLYHISVVNVATTNSVPLKPSSGHPQLELGHVPIIRDCVGKYDDTRCVTHVTTYNLTEVSLRSTCPRLVLGLPDDWCSRAGGVSALIQVSWWLKDR